MPFVTRFTLLSTRQVIKRWSCSRSRTSGRILDEAQIPFQHSTLCTTKRSSTAGLFLFLCFCPGMNLCTPKSLLPASQHWNLHDSVSDINEQNCLRMETTEWGRSDSCKTRQFEMTNGEKGVMHCQYLFCSCCPSRISMWWMPVLKLVHKRWRLQSALFRTLTSGRTLQDATDIQLALIPATNHTDTAQRINTQRNKRRQENLQPERTWCCHIGQKIMQPLRVNSCFAFSPGKIAWQVFCFIRKQKKYTCI